MPKRNRELDDRNPSRELVEHAAEIEEGREVVRRTIVGGRPIDRRRRKLRIPIGIEKVLCRAAADRRFREQFLMARADALTGTDLEVSRSEAMILASVSEDALRTMIENIDLKRHRKRRFFRGIAAASLAATTVLGTVSCGEGEYGTAGGAAPDWPETVDAVVDTVDRTDVVDLLEAEDVLCDLGMTDGSDAADVLDVEDVFCDAGMTDEEGPPDIQEVDVPDVDAPADVIDSETAMDGGMWADDVNDE